MRRRKKNRPGIGGQRAHALHLHAAFIHRHGNALEACGGDGFTGALVERVFDQHLVVRIHEYLRTQAKRLL
ncbi:hypothetical protein D3C76_1707410 [compost metagenome]